MTITLEDWVAVADMFQDLSKLQDTNDDAFTNSLLETFDVDEEGLRMFTTAMTLGFFRTMFENVAAGGEFPEFDVVIKAVFLNGLMLGLAVSKQTDTNST